MGWKRKVLEAMGDEEVADVHLVGTDGEEVPCCKTDLAKVSPVFRKMFFGEFRERRADRCKLDFHSVIIKLIVKYCCCGEVDIGLIFGNGRSLQQEASLLVDVREAGRYFHVEDLSLAAETEIGNLVFQKKPCHKKYQYAYEFLTELKRDEDSEALRLLIFGFVVENVMECFGPSVPEDTNHANPIILLNVLQATEDTYATVRCLQRWFSLESKGAGNSYSDDEKRALLDVAENIDLKRISTKQLSNIKPCSLFSSERILEAFVHHCKDDEIATEAPRTMPMVCVCGAGSKHLNGSYFQLSNGIRTLNIFARQVEHNGASCFSIIHRNLAENKWLISISKDDDNLVGDKNQMSNVSIQSHVYESPCRPLLSEESNIPPFSGWKCVEGSGQGPLVACIYHQKAPQCN